MHTEWDCYMGFFGFKKKFNSEEYEKLSKRITDIESTLDKLHSSFMSLRGLIHRKATGDLDLDNRKQVQEQIDDGLNELRGK